MDKRESAERGLARRGSCLRVADWPGLRRTVRCTTLACLSDANNGRGRGCQDVPPTYAAAVCTRSIRQADAVGPIHKPTLRASALTSPTVCSTMSEVGGIA